MSRALDHALAAVRDAETNAYQRGYTDGRNSVLGRDRYAEGVAEGMRRAKAAIERERSNPSVPSGASDTRTYSTPDHCNGYGPDACTRCHLCCRGPVPADFYVSVSFTPGGRGYYYVTNDPCIVPGSKVLVDAVGQDKVGRVDFTRRDKPYLSGKSIKRVISRVSC